jgi:plastocyanin
VTVCLLVLAAVPAGGCGSSAPSQAAATATPTADVVVAMRNLRFAPKRVTIHKGQTVEWIDKDLVDHSVVSGALASPDFAQGETWSHTFGRAGVFRYHDRLHPDMTGTVVVRR